MQRILYSTTKRYLIRQSLIKNCAITNSKILKNFEFRVAVLYKIKNLQIFDVYKMYV